jgi:HTH-type transcriptional regulator, transcriptional repressor of NAD biosynthesis genes
MKKFKNSLVLGKMYPFTKGHQYLIDSAVSQSEIVHVIITHNTSQTIPGEVRFNAIKETYKNNKNVKVYSVSDEGLPAYDHECETLDEFYSYWVPLVYSEIEDLDAVFTSENYGDDFAKYLGVAHVLVDKDRLNVPISGTMIRQDPFKNWNYIADEMKSFFVKRIAIMGPESVGKSTLTKNVSNNLGTNFVPEYGRLIYEINNSVTIDDFIPISKGRQEIEDWMIKFSKKYLICDTEDITTYIFSKMYCPDEYQKVEPYFLNALKTKPKYDLYILLKPDCEGVQDGTRNFLEERWDHYEVIKSHLISYGCNFVEVGGEWRERENEVIRLINEL